MQKGGGCKRKGKGAGHDDGEDRSQLCAANAAARRKLGTNESFGLCRAPDRTRNLNCTFFLSNHHQLAPTSLPSCLSLPLPRPLSFVIFYPLLCTGQPSTRICVLVTSRGTYGLRDPRDVADWIRFRALPWRAAPTSKVISLPPSDFDLGFHVRDSCSTLSDLVVCRRCARFSKSGMVHLMTFDLAVATSFCSLLLVPRM
ncbi:hypothetical protein PENSPDRAFT_359430 [Peniophora sp. CONT]|nr:hypothetical protein PENSPDRAFT_359430 [Peniophora sp. CONT]